MSIHYTVTTWLSVYRWRGRKKEELFIRDLLAKRILQQIEFYALYNKTTTTSTSLIPMACLVFIIWEIAFLFFYRSGCFFFFGLNHPFRNWNINLNYSVRTAGSVVNSMNFFIIFMFKNVWNVDTIIFNHDFFCLCIWIPIPMITQKR